MWPPVATPVPLPPRAGVEPGDTAPDGFCCLLSVRGDERIAKRLSKYDKESKATSYTSTLVDLKEKRGLGGE
jgi:hypothetical protein